ncbi:MAG: sulfatase-like hydrolase/transferase [Acidimicrobiia bacterium]
MSRTDANREGDDHRSEPAIRTRLVGLSLAMVGLWSVAVLGPYLELATEPAFVVAHGLSAAGTAVFGVGLVVGLPLLVAAGCWTVGRVANTPVAWSLAVSILAGLAVTGLLRELGWLSLGLGVTAGVLVHVRRWHRTLAVTVLATLVSLIVWFGPSDVGTYIRAGDAGAAAAAIVPRPVPVVVIVFDELPVHALLSADLTVNAERFPAFADLARQSTFFRLTSSVSPQTSDSLPALLSGVEPHPERAAVGANYPTLILSLFSGSHEVFASEAFTRLCDGENCAGTAERSVGVGLLIEDTAVYLADAVLPFYENDAVRRSWSHFRSGSKANGAAGQDGSPSVDIVAGGWDAETEAARLRALFATKPTGDRPPLYFLHSILPHQPYVLTTDGTVYPPIELPGTVGSTFWPDDERVRLVGWQRLQMQLVATDKLLGEAVELLRKGGLWDDAIVIVTSDHGLTFEPGPQRQPGSAPLEVTAVPLFIKTPAGTEVGLSDLPALTIDIAPTLVALQGGQPDAFAFDGVDLYGGDIPTVRTDAYRSGGRLFTPVQDIEELRHLVALRAEWISTANGPPQLFRIGASGSLVGELPPRSPSPLEGASARVPSDFGLRTPDRSHLVAVITVVGYDGDEILVAVNDIIAGVGIRVGQSEFHVALDPGLVADRVTSIQILTPSGMLISSR